MIKIIWQEFKNLLSPFYVFLIGVIILFIWRICLPPFDYKAIYDTSRIIGMYELIISSIGLFSFFILLITHLRKINNNSNRYLLTLRISGEKYFFGLYFLYYAFFFMAFVIPANLSVLLQQFIYAPQQIEPGYIFYSIAGYFFSYYHHVIIIAIIIAHQINDDFLAQILFLCFQIFLVTFSASTGMNLFSSRYLILQFCSNQDQVQISEYFLFWLICTIIIFVVGLYYSNTILYKSSRTKIKSHFLFRWMDRCQLHVTAHHIEMMNLGPQRTISVCLLIGLFMLAGVNHTMQNQLIDSVRLYVILVIPIVFAFNQSFVLKIDQDTGMRESIVLKSRNYSTIILNRWLVLVSIQIMIQFIAILVVFMFTGFWEIIYAISAILFGIFISLFNLIINVLTRSNGTANLILIFLIYIQLNEDIRIQVEKYINFSLLNENLLRAQPGNSKTALFLSIQIIILLILIRIAIQMTKYVRIRFHN